MNIASRKSWGARYQDGVGNRPVGTLEKYLHHTVTAHLSPNATVAQERAEMRKIEAIGQQRFGCGISYTFIIFPSGRIYQGASVNRISYHSGGSRNTRGAGICLAGNYETHPITDKVIESVVWLLQEGVRRNWWNDPAITAGHRDFKQTSCPGKNAYNKIDEINALGRGSSVPDVKPKPKPTPAAKEYPEIPLLVDGDWKKRTTKALQIVLPKKYNHGKNLRVDGDFKELTIKATQRWLDALGYDVGPADGDWGRRSKKALQSFLYDKGLYRVGRYSKRVLVDGDFKDQSVKGLQRYLNDQRRYL